MVAATRSSFPTQHSSLDSLYASAPAPQSHPQSNTMPQSLTEGSHPPYGQHIVPRPLAQSYDYSLAIPPNQAQLYANRTADRPYQDSLYGSPLPRSGTHEGNGPSGTSASRCQTNKQHHTNIYTGMPIVSLFSTPLFSGQSLRFVTCPGLACHIRADLISVYDSFIPTSTVSPREQDRWDTIAVSSLSSTHTRRSLARICLYDDSEHSIRAFSGKHGSSGRPVPSWSI